MLTLIKTYLINLYKFFTNRGVRLFFKHITRGVIFGLILTVLILQFYIEGEIIQGIEILNNRISINEMYREKQLKDLTSAIITLAELTAENDILQLKEIEDVKINVEKLNELIDNQLEKMKNFRTIDIEYAKKLQEANLFVFNISKGYCGSGTHIKINGESYLLTCSHLIKDIGDDFIFDVYGAGLVKIDRKNDLALFKFNIEPNLDYIEISDVAPTVGSEVYIIGNPDEMIDVLTDGVVANIGKGYYIATNKIFFGNSGGAIIYNSKLIGVVTQFRIEFAFPVITNYAYAVDLETVKEFLSDINE